MKIQNYDFFYFIDKINSDIKIRIRK